MIALTTVLSIPSPSSGVWHLGPLPLRGYALAIIAGIVAAIWPAWRASRLDILKAIAADG